MRWTPTEADQVLLADLGLPEHRVHELLEFGARGIRDSWVRVKLRSPYTGRLFGETHIGQKAFLLHIYLDPPPDAGESYEFYMSLRSGWNRKRFERAFVPIETPEDSLVVATAAGFRSIWHHRAWLRRESRSVGSRNVDVERYAIRRLSQFRVETDREPFDEAKGKVPKAMRRAAERANAYRQIQGGAVAAERFRGLDLEEDERDSPGFAAADDHQEPFVRGIEGLG